MVCGDEGDSRKKGKEKEWTHVAQARRGISGKVTKLWRNICVVGLLVILFVPDSLSLGTNHIVLLLTNGWEWETDK